MDPEVKTRRDLRAYRYCIDHGVVIDFWKYESMEDAGHSECNTRMLTREEYEEAVKECEKVGCFDE